jgi:hypothetical protein
LSFFESWTTSAAILTRFLEEHDQSNDVADFGKGDFLPCILGKMENGKHFAQMEGKQDEIGLVKVADMLDDLEK